MAVSSQGMQDRFGAKSANWLAGWPCGLSTSFLISWTAKPCNEVETFSERWQLLIVFLKFTMASVNQEDEFTEVTRKRKKHKAISSPTLPTLQKTGSPELPPGTPTRPKPASIKNNIPVILSGIKTGINLWANWDSSTLVSKFRKSRSYQKAISLYWWLYARRPNSTERN